MSTEPHHPTGVCVASAAVEATSATVPTDSPEVDSTSSAGRAHLVDTTPEVVASSGSTASTAATAKGRHVSRPMVVAAAVAGAVLVALPVAFSAVSDDSGPSDDTRDPGYAFIPRPADGFVPGLAQPSASGGASSAALPSDPVVVQAGTDPAGIPVGPAGQQAMGGRNQTPVQNQSPGQQAGSTPVAAQPTTAARVTYEGMAGPGCGGTTMYNSVGLYRDGKEGWVDQGNGGCGTSFVTVPMSGDANRDDPGQYALWMFHTGPVAVGSCTVSVFVPNGDVTKAGGDPTYYRVFNRFDISKTGPIGSFTVRQVAHRGTWVTVGSFRVSDSKLAVQLLNRGQDWEGTTKTYAHHAAAMVRARCTS